MKRDFLLFISTVSLYLLNKAAMSHYTNDVLHWFMSYYFNDIVGSVAFLAYCNFLLATQKRRLTHLFHIVLLMFVCGLVWEFIAPLIREDTVTDLFDFGAYILGGCIYWCIDQNRMLYHRQKYRDYL